MSAPPTFTCTLVWVVNLPAFTLSLGVILNLNKWLQYLLKIMAFVRVNTNGDEDSFLLSEESSLSEVVESEQ
jgi:hypothetical protein